MRCWVYNKHEIFLHDLVLLWSHIFYIRPSHGPQVVSGQWWKMPANCQERPRAVQNVRVKRGNTWLHAGRDCYIGECRRWQHSLTKCSHCHCRHLYVLTFPISDCIASQLLTPLYIQFTFYRILLKAVCVEVSKRWHRAPSWAAEPPPPRPIPSVSNWHGTCTEVQYALLFARLDRIKWNRSWHFVIRFSYTKFL